MNYKHLLERISICEMAENQTGVQHLLHPRYLLNCLLQTVELRGGKELTQGNLQSIADHLDRQDLGIVAPPVKNILDTGWRQPGDSRQLADGNAPFIT